MKKLFSMKKLLSMLMAVLMMCGMMTVPASAATSTVISCLGYNNEQFLNITYDNTTHQLTAISTRSRAHGSFIDREYFTFNYYNADNTLKYGYTIIGNVYGGINHASALVAEINKTVVNAGDYIKINHAEEVARLKITDLDGKASGDMVKDGYIYLGGTNLEYTKKLKTDSKNELQAKIAEAKALPNGNYSSTSWNELQAVISNANAVVEMRYVTDAQIAATKSEIDTAIARLSSTYSFHIKGYYDREVLTLDVDLDNMMLKAVSSTVQSHSGFYDHEYFRIEVVNKDNQLRVSSAAKGIEVASKVAEALNNYPLEEGDSIYVYHREAITRLWIEGPVLGVNHDLTKGFRTIQSTYDTDIHFQIINGKLVFRSSMPDFSDF